ncbi:OLC1v1022822C1 [Oldenlandia corymbosa var. corymbosa]|uniref:OLC1v1022822C1 n=1 Tax=Oldenlandia corymbosa var. corymbosa TaxID=529605 RepID=A0AAV1BYT4_OLDCO|nr:OLC1v1022822C1 [Oldenlandia corymbosa var. corymbosa]
MDHRYRLKCSYPLFILAIFLLTINAWTSGTKVETKPTIDDDKTNDGDQCKDVIQGSPEFGYCLKSISQKWPTELALIPCCQQFKKMDENCRCQAVMEIVNAAIAAATAGAAGGSPPARLAPSGGLPNARSRSRDTAK